MMGPLVVALASTGAGAATYTVDVHSSYFRALPPVSTDSVVTPTRTIPERRVALPGGASFVGARAGFGFVVDDRIVLPLFGLCYAHAASGTKVRASLDGSIADVPVASASILSIALPGFGFRFKHRRWAGQFVAHTGYTWLSVPGTVAAAGEAYDLTTSARSFVARIELEGCRRFDPENRGCLYVAPAIYELGWASSLHVGLRWEVGP